MDSSFSIPEEYNATPEVTQMYATKRKRNPKNWKKKKQKNERHEARNKGCIFSCQHKDKPYCKVRSIDVVCLYKFHELFWIKERMFLQRYIEVSPIQRTRVDDENNRRRSLKKYNILCQIPINDDEFIPVCNASFMSILSIGRTRLENAAASMFNTDLMVERRGGNTSKLEALKSQIIEHIQSFKCREKHYGKMTKFNRVYLPVELNVKKMHELFIEKYNVSSKYCKYHYYYNIFRTMFNIGFGTLRTDTCPTCESYKIKKNAEMDGNSRKMLIVEQMVHVTRARRFFQLLNKVEERSITINFDLIQVKPLPLTQIGGAYYARQISYYTFGIVIHNEKKLLNKETVFFYRWLETEFKRGYNQIISCLLNFLKENIVPLIQNGQVDLICFFCDSCTGQNKNYFLLLTLHDFCKRNKVYFAWYFPTRGHSYIPADRAFSFLWKRIKKKSLILFPREYDEIANQVGNLIIAGKDLVIRDYKRSSETLLKADKGFKITDAKVLLYNHTKDQLSYKITYGGPEQVCDPVKKSKRKARLPKPPVVRSCNHASEEKLADVKGLLNQLGFQIDEMEFYKDIKATAEKYNEAENIGFINEDLH